MIEVDTSLYGKNLKRLMWKRDMTTERLYELTGISTNSIYLYREGKTFPTSTKIQVIAKALGFEVGEFFREEQK